MIKKDSQVETKFITSKPSDDEETKTKNVSNTADQITGIRNVEVVTQARIDQEKEKLNEMI